MLLPYHAILAPALVLSLVVPTSAATATSAHPEATPALTSFTDSQSFSVSAHTVESSVVRDKYGAIAKPKPKPAPTISTNRWSGGPIPVAGRSGASIVAFAKQFVGKVPYGSGNHPSSSFSCDGLVQYVFAAHGVSLPRMADSQAARGVIIPRSSAQAGDLVYYPGQHIGIYAGGGMMIDSPRPGKYVSHRAVWGNPLYVRIP